MNPENLTSLKDMAKYINDTYDDILAVYDEEYNCIDIEGIGRCGEDNYKDCLFSARDFMNFIKNKGN